MQSDFVMCSMSRWILRKKYIFLVDFTLLSQSDLKKEALEQSLPQDDPPIRRGHAKRALTAP
jgi:hypothetical protein